MQRILLTLSLLVWFSLGLKGQQSDYQKGFVVTSNQDTLNGKIHTKFKSNNTIKFKNSKTPKTITTLKPEDVLAIYYGQDYIRSIKIKLEGKKEEVIFIKQLLRGNINLYRGYAEDIGKIYFIQREGQEKPIAINKDEINNFLSGYFADCTGVKAKAAFNYRSIYNAILQYNDCLYPGSKIEVLEELPEKVRFGITANAGYVVQNNTLDGFYRKGQVVKTDNFQFTLGGVVEVHRLVDFRIGVSYLNKDIPSKEFHYTYLVETETGIDSFLFRSNISFTHRFLEIPIGFAVNIFNKKVNKVGIIGGVNWLIPIENKIENDFSTPYYVSNPDIPLQIYSNSRFRDITSHSYYIGAEYAFKFNKNNYLSFRSRFSNERVRYYILHDRTYGDGDRARRSDWKTKRIDFMIGYSYIF